MPRRIDLLDTNELAPEFSGLRDRYSDICVVVSPPRCSSTAFARVFWEHPEFRYYSHEPFEISYYQERPLHEVVEKLENPLDLAGLTHSETAPVNGALIIKEMPYQVGKHFPILASLGTRPLIFLIRDPRLNIASRIEKKVEVGDSPFYPQVESGWELVARQMEAARRIGIPFLVVDASDFRNHPREIFPQIFERLGFAYSHDVLRWKACQDVDLDNLEGDHRHLYSRALESTGLERADEPIPSIDSFPEENGFRDHVRRSLLIYERLAAAPERIGEVDSDDGAS